MLMSLVCWLALTVTTTPGLVTDVEGTIHAGAPAVVSVPAAATSAPLWCSSSR